MDSIVIKRITTDDQLYQSERELRNKILLRPIGLPNYAWEMHDNKSWHFVALINDLVVGCVVLVPLDKNKEKAQLTQMAVDNSVQGRGIGTKLMNELLEFSKQQGIKEIECHARDNAVNFYSKSGFETYGELFEEVGVAHRHMRMSV